LSSVGGGYFVHGLRSLAEDHEHVTFPRMGGWDTRGWEIKGACSGALGGGARLATESEVIRITACKQTCRKQRNMDSHGEREREREKVRGRVTVRVRVRVRVIGSERE
jgi:hypothetical protein